VIKLDDYEKYELDCERIRKENGEILLQFKGWLQDSQLSEKTIRNHVLNIDFYVNEFLLYRDAIEAKDGANKISYFLGDWFARKALWSSVYQINGYCTSFKKFYTFMHENGHIDLDTLEEMKEVIKEEKADWIDAMERYDDMGSLY
jgi:intergrase/recombinase